MVREEMVELSVMVMVCAELGVIEVVVCGVVVGEVREH
jgi:hypothetical protein